MFLSVFDVFKIGVGPSSSHTMGPMSAANRFLALILSDEWPRPSQAHVAAIKVSLHGSLAHTGIGHGTGRAVVLGLMGERPDEVDPDRMDAIISAVESSGQVTPTGHPVYAFQPKTDLIFDKKVPLPGHANGMSFSALDRDGRLLLKRIYYSVGGGFVVTDTELEQMRANKKTASSGDKIPFPFSTAKQMLDMAERSGLTIAQMKRANEESHMTREALDSGLDRIWEAMNSCIDRGLKTEGIMPGGLKVRRRAKRDPRQAPGRMAQQPHQSPARQRLAERLRHGRQRGECRRRSRRHRSDQRCGGGHSRRRCATTCIFMRMRMSMASATTF